MEIVYLLLYFVFGTIIGSFLNVVVLRYYLRSSVKGHSFCFSCRRKLSWYELVPVVSYIALRGHCKSCKSSISTQYILVELGTGILFASLVLKGYTDFSVIIPAITLSLLVAIFVYDIRHKIVPDALVYTFIVLSFINLFVDIGTLSIGIPSLAAIFSGPILFLPFFCLWFFSKGEWMGLGDGKLVLGMGWFLGLEGGITAVALSFWIALAVIIVMFLVQHFLKSRKGILKKKLSRKTEIPFAPFLILGYLVVFYFEFNLVTLIM